MGIYFYWGEDEFQLNRAIATLRQQTLDPDWASFNYDRIPPEQSDGPIQALNQAMTPPFGLGKRLVWLADTSLGKSCPEAVLKEMERTLPQLPETTVLLLTSPNKPDGRSKFTKLLQKYGEVREFAAIPPWKTDQLLRQVHQAAKTVGLKLTDETADRLVDAVGNNTRQLYTELEKLSLYWGQPDHPLPPQAVADLVTLSTQSSLDLADALRQGQTDKALSLTADLLRNNEPALRIVATLVGQFRRWLWVKLLMEAGERDERVLSQAAEIPNPKRIYFLQKDVRLLSLIKLQTAYMALLDLEASLKQGADEVATLQTKFIEISQLFC